MQVQTITKLLSLSNFEVFEVFLLGGRESTRSKAIALSLTIGAAVVLSRALIAIPWRGSR